jgi:hypothetical protein
MTDLSLARPAALERLRAAGHDPATIEEALTAAEEVLDADRATAAVWLYGEGDLRPA